MYPHQLPTNTSYSRTAGIPTPKLKAALAFARRGIPVFPCKPGGKEPLTRHGFKDATTDPRKITAWWTRYQNANIGVPSGERSGLLVVDVDPRHGGTGSLAALAAEHGELPATTTSKTGSGGMHIMFKYPAGSSIRNSAGKLGPGLDVRGCGGYVLAPGSVTKSPYEWLDRSPLADIPDWVLQKLREPSRGHRAKPREKTRVKKPPIPVGEIPEGTRNWSLYREGCRLRARGYDRTAILASLEQTNSDRCAPPLEPAELEKIATSAARHAPGNASPEVTPDVLEMINSIRRSWWVHEWKGMGGYSARDVEHALLQLAGQHGQMIPVGVRVSVDYRTVALIAGVGVSTVHRAVKRLKEAGRLRADNADRQRGEAGAFVLVSHARIVEHSTTRVSSREKPLDVVPVCAPPTAPRLRWSRPVLSRVANEIVRETLRRAGKIAGAIVDHLERTGDWITWKDLAAMMGHKRPRDLRARQGKYLAEAHVVECSGDAVRLTADWLDALSRMRSVDGEISDHRRNMAEYARQRDAYRNRHRNTPDRAPTAREMDLARRGADAYVEELERIEPEPEAVEPEPEAVEAVEEMHSVSCECLNCSISAPRYVTYYKGAA